MASMYSSAVFGQWINRHAPTLMDSEGRILSPLTQMTVCAVHQAPRALSSLRTAVEGSTATTAEILAYSPVSAPAPRTGAPSPAAAPPADDVPCYGCRSDFIRNILGFIQTISGPFVLFCSFLFVFFFFPFFTTPQELWWCSEFWFFFSHTPFTCFPSSDPTHSSRKVQEELVEAGLVEELYELNIREGPAGVRAGVIRLLFDLCEESVAASERVTAALVRRVEGVVDAALRSPGTALEAVAALAPDMDLLDLLAQPSPAPAAFRPWTIRLQGVFRLVDRFCDIMRSGAVAPQCLFQYVLTPLLFTLCNTANETFNIREQPVAALTFPELAHVLKQIGLDSLNDENAAEGNGNSESKPQRDEEGDDECEDEDEEEGEREREEDHDDKSSAAAPMPPKRLWDFPPEFGLFFTGRFRSVSTADDSTAMGDDEGDDADMEDEDDDEEYVDEEVDEEAIKKETAEMCRKFMLSRLVRLWKTKAGQAKPRVECIGDFLNERIFRDFLLCQQCELVRVPFATLIALFAMTHRETTFNAVKILVNMLPDVMKMKPEVTSEYYSLLLFLLFDERLRCYVEVRYHMTQQLLDGIWEAAQRIATAENSGRALRDAWCGADVWVPLQVLGSLLYIDTIRTRFRTGDHTSRLLSAFITMRSLVLNSSSFTTKSAQGFWQLLLLLQKGDPDRTAFMRAYVSVMVSLASANPRSSAFLMDQMIGMIEPKKVEIEYFLELQKIRSQAEYFAGNMDHNPYSSKEIGTTMRDVKRKICTTLNMLGVLEDDNGLELLVDGNIINLNLPIRLVYEKIWLPNHPLRGRLGDRDAMRANPMRVIYRLQGLDGEATEPMIDAIQEDAVVEDTGARDRMIAVILECGGQNALVNVLRSTPAHRTLQSRALITGAFKLLELCCKVPTGRRIVLDAGGLAVVVRKLRDVLQALAALEPSAKSVQGQLEQLFCAGLAVAAPLAQEATESAAASGTQDILTRVYGTDTHAGEENVRAMIAAMVNPVLSSNTAVCEGLYRLVPSLTFGDPVLSGCVAQFLKDRLDAALLAQTYSTSQGSSSSNPTPSSLKKAVEAVAAIVRWSPPALKSFFVTDGIQLHKALCSHIQSVLEGISSGMCDGESTDEIDTLLSVPSVATVLEILLSLVTGHADSQRALLGCGNIVSLLHRMEERHADKTGVGLLAESVLDAMHDSDEAKSAVDNIRNADRKEKEELANKRREALLKKMGMKQDGHKILMKAAAAFGVPEDEAGLSCSVCQEGYTFKPDELLGAYVYHYRVPMHSFLLTKAPTPSSECDGVMTITAFNVIHFQCHIAATHGERAKKQPLSEWDAALVRNQMVHCNAILPLDGPEVAHDKFTRASVTYLVEELQSHNGARAITVLVHDLMFSLMRLSYEGSDVFDTQQLLEVHARHSGGKRPASLELGGRESTLQLCPWVVSLVAELVASGTCTLDVARCFADFFAVAPAEWARHGERADNPPYHLALALAFLPHAQWAGAKLAMLRALLAYAYAEGRACRRADDAAMQALDVAGVFRTCQPALVMLLLVDRMQDALKRALPPCAAPDRAWLHLVHQSVVAQGKACSDAFGKLYADLDEMKTYADFQEVFDVLGVLPAVLDSQKTLVPPAQNEADSFVLALWRSFA